MISKSVAVSVVVLVAVMILGVPAVYAGGHGRSNVPSFSQVNNAPQFAATYASGAHINGGSFLQNQAIGNAQANLCFCTPLGGQLNQASQTAVMDITGASFHGSASSNSAIGNSMTSGF